MYLHINISVKFFLRNVHSLRQQYFLQIIFNFLIKLFISTPWFATDAVVADPHLHLRHHVVAQVESYHPAQLLQGLPGNSHLNGIMGLGMKLIVLENANVVLCSLFMHTVVPISNTCPLAETFVADGDNCMYKN